MNDAIRALFEGFEAKDVTAKDAVVNELIRVGQLSKDLELFARQRAHGLSQCANPAGVLESIFLKFNA